MRFKVESGNTVKRYFFNSVNLFLMFLIIFLLGLKVYRIVSFDNLAEMREMNVVKMAAEFADGRNPYALNTLNASKPYVTNLYGMLSTLWMALFMCLTKNWMHLSILQLAQLAILIVELIGIGIMFLNIKHNTEKNSTILALFGSLVFLQCFYRGYPFSGAFPDTMGVMLQVYLLYQVSKDVKKNVYHPMLYAICMIALFFVKQYFVVAAFGMLIFLILNADKKCVFQYVISGILGGIITFSVVQLIFPLYFTETLCLTKISTGFGDWYFSLSQIPGIMIRVIIFVLAIFFGLFISFKKGNVDCWKRYDLIQGVCMLVFTAYFAQNHGACLTYYLQMWTPYIISLGAFCLGKEYEFDSRKAKYYTATMLTAGVLTLWAIKGIITCVPVSSNIAQEWQNAEKILDDYVSKGEVIVSPVLSNYCMKNNIYTHDYGQASYLGQDQLTEYEKQSALKQIFPFAGEILTRYVAYTEEIINRVHEGYYSLIAISNDEYNISEDDLVAGGYKLVYDHVLVTGWEYNHIYYWGK